MEFVVSLRATRTASIKSPWKKSKGAKIGTM
jgi:hypothetical protein